MRISTETARQLRVMSSFAAGSVKQAELGGAGNDVSFEQAFSNLAHSYLKDKAPTLLDHELGFQLLDKNQDNTKAIGVFGFKVGTNLIYAPVVFLNGSLKGHELLYLKNQDMFVPMKENWLNYIMNRKPNMVGKSVDRNSSRLGMLMPDFSRMINSPRNKMAADMSLSEVMEPVLPVFASCATLNVKQALAELGEAVNLPDFLKRAGLEMIERVVSMCQEYPELASAIDQFHGLDMISEAIKVAAARPRIVKSAPQIITGSIADDGHPIKSGALKVITYDVTLQTTDQPETTPEDAEKLLRDKVLIKDKRDDAEVSIPYHVRVEERLQNPTETGLYEVLTKAGEFEKCLVITGPYGPDRQSFVTVVRTGDSPDWVNKPACDVWTAHQYSPEEFTEWYDSLKDAGSLSVGETKYILVGPRGHGTLPFRVRAALDLGDGTKSYDVFFSSYCDRSTFATGSRAHSYRSFSAYDQNSGCCYGEERIHINGKEGSKIRAVRGDVYIPEGYKVVTASKSRDWDETGSKTPAIAPGDLLDSHMHLMSTKHDSRSSAEKTSFVVGTKADARNNLMSKLAELSLTNNGSYYTVNGVRRHQIDTLVHLVTDHGLREKASRHIMGLAQHKGHYHCHIKYAAPYGQASGSPFLTDSGPAAQTPPEPPVSGGSFMHSDIATRYPQNDAMQVTGLEPGRNDPNIYNPNPMYDRRPSEMDMQQMLQAAQSGQKEVFDTSAISSLLKAVRDDSMVDRYLGDLTKGLDRLGRIMLFFYWHGDTFADRYGKQDMPELEDSLRNSFESLGDIIIFLKQKSIDPYPDEGNIDTDLKDIANQ